MIILEIKQIIYNCARIQGLREKVESRNVTTPATLMDLIRNLVPPNLMQATMQQYRTNLKYPGNYAFNDSSGKGKKQLRIPGEIETWKISGEILTVR